MALPMAVKRLPAIPIDPPPEYFAAVGEVAVRWSRLEYQLGVLARVGFKLGKDEQRTLIVGMDMTVLTAVLRAVAQGWISDRKIGRDIEKFTDELADLRGKRGDYVHGLYGYWLGKPDKWFMFKLKSRQRGNINADPVSPAEISAFAEKLRRLQLRAQQLTTRELKAVHGTRP